MNIDLTTNERKLHSLQGKLFAINPIIRLFSKLLKIVGLHTQVEIQLTNKRLHISIENYALWAIITGRERKVISLEQIDMIHGIQTSFLFIFKSNNLVFYSGGIPWTSINLKGSNYDSLETELNGISLAKTLNEDIRKK